MGLSAADHQPEELVLRSSRIPPTAVGGSFKYSLHRDGPLRFLNTPTAVGGSFKNSLHRDGPLRFLNTPNGSWGIVQVQPKSTQFFVLPEYNWKSFKHKPSAARLLVGSICQVYRLAMRLEPLANLHWAFQLHYLLCFRTNRRRTLFAENNRMALLSDWLTEICGRHEYHLLEAEPHADHLRCLLSLRPNHSSRM
jgi:hypothetical protein